MTIFNAISLFTGAGGLDVGFKKAGFNVVWANELDEDACNTYSLNHDSTIVRGDLRDNIEKLSKFSNIDVVFGGPPCQGFSVAGKMDPNDERSKLIFSFMDVVEAVQPKAFVLENVKALAVLGRWEPVRNALFERAKSLGFDFVEIVVLNATEYGVPQKRERMFLIGIKGGNKIPAGMLGMSSYIQKYKKKAPPVKSILKKLGPVGSENNPATCKAKITIAKKPILRKSPYAGMLFNGAGRPLDPNGYSNTLPASMGGNRTPIIDEHHVFNGTKSWIEEYHKEIVSGKDPQNFEVPKHLRRITLNEAAEIQTFPEDYKFYGRQNSIYKQIGNAVPCELAYAVSSGLFDALGQLRAL
ncbi:DNA (cytosine-5-)-methyltransferase [Candidatus Peregrinibacteria bacterium CG10_big_fil_rev_8_21_14_0_10_36_19]|nr:MAG: DNA (cytosine-5-)-methyltransferase [Candidatus Peregrinibacteria bacterium CG10_big_fil_rev_8_21_14_0_10_36_19]